jgi:hypothetical protein
MNQSAVSSSTSRSGSSERGRVGTFPHRRSIDALRLASEAQARSAQLVHGSNARFRNRGGSPRTWFLERGISPARSARMSDSDYFLRIWAFGFSPGLLFAGTENNRVTVVSMPEPQDLRDPAEAGFSGDVRRALGPWGGSKDFRNTCCYRRPTIHSACVC